MHCWTYVRDRITVRIMRAMHLFRWDCVSIFASMNEENLKPYCPIAPILHETLSGSPINHHAGAVPNHTAARHPDADVGLPTVHSLS